MNLLLEQIERLRCKESGGFVRIEDAVEALEKLEADISNSLWYFSMESPVNSEDYLVEN